MRAGYWFVPWGMAAGFLTAAAQRQEGAMRLAIHRFLADDTGATVIEYGLIAGMISVTAIAALQTMGESLRTVYEFVTILSVAATGP